MAIKKPAVTDLVPNPLHNYASYTYSWSLWWLDKADYNRLASQPDVTQALAWNPGPKSYVIAEDGGRYPNRRHPATLGLNYHIQEVNFTSTIGPNKVSKSTSLVNGNMTIVEPYGVTLIDSLVAASFDGEKFTNYNMHPYMLQLDFMGYDDKGNPMSNTAMALHRKRFPITLQTMKISVTGSGSQYRMDFVPANSAPVQNEFSTTPETFSITAGTVKEFFNGPNGLAAQYFKNQIGLVGTGSVEYADTIKFDLDPTIAESKIVYDKQIPINLGDLKGKGIKLDKSTFVIPQGANFVDIINRVMSHSDYLINLQLGLEDTAGGPVGPKDQTAIFNAFKTTTSTIFAGVNKSGEIKTAVYDNGRGRSPVAMTYNIHQYPVWTGASPNISQFPDSIPYTVKEYNYIYTGKNVDIIDFKIEFNNTYFNAVNTYNTQFAAAESSENTKVDEDANQSSGILGFSPSKLAVFVPQLKLVPAVSQSRFKHIAGDPNTTTGMNIKQRPAAQKAADTLKTIYGSTPSGSNDMISVPLTIVGDPTLIKQDDWLYSPSPVRSADYIAWDNQSQAEYVAKYGHIRMDAGQLIVSLTFNTPLDIDSDWANNGLVYPAANTRTALFSGQYHIITIENRFRQGKFEQLLNLSRFINTDYVQAYSQKKTSERTGTLGGENGDADAQEGGFYGNPSGATGDKNLVPTNSVTPGGDLQMTPEEQAEEEANALKEPVAVVGNGLSAEEVQRLEQWQVNVNGERE